MRNYFLSITVCALLYVQCMAQHSTAIYLPVAKFITGNNEAYAAETFDDATWQEIKTGTVWQEQGHDGYHGYAWYRIHVNIPSSLKERSLWKDSLRIFLAHVNDVDETYLNGARIGKTGSYPNDPE